MSLKIDLEIEKGVGKTFLFPAGGPTPVKLAVLPILFPGSCVSGGLHLVFGFQIGRLPQSRGRGPRFFRSTHSGVYACLSGLWRAWGLGPSSRSATCLFGTGRVPLSGGWGRRAVFRQGIQFLLRVKLAKALDDDFAVLVVARHEVGAMRIKVFEVKEAIGAHGAYAVGRFPTAVTGGEDCLLGLVVCT